MEMSGRSICVRLRSLESWGEIRRLENVRKGVGDVPVFHTPNQAADPERLVSSGRVRQARCMSAVCMLLALATLAPPPPQDRFGVTELPKGESLGHASARELRREGFVKGIAVDVHGEGPVWIVAQDGVSDLSLIHI